MLHKLAMPRLHLTVDVNAAKSNKNVDVPAAKPNEKNVITINSDTDSSDEETQKKKIDKKLGNTIYIYTVQLISSCLIFLQCFNVNLSCLKIQFGNVTHPNCR